MRERGGNGSESDRDGIGTYNFIAKAKRYIDRSNLLRLFIEKIVVHEKDVKWSKYARQTVEIYYTDIGVVGSLNAAKSA